MRELDGVPTVGGYRGVLDDRIGMLEAFRVQEQWMTIDEEPAPDRR